MNRQREALEGALKALNQIPFRMRTEEQKQLIDKIGIALEEPIEKPVGYFEQIDDDVFEQCWPDDEDATPLYRYPPERHPLTDEEIHEIWTKTSELEESTPRKLVTRFTREIERAHKIGEAPKTSQKKTESSFDFDFFLKWSACVITVVGCLLTSLHLDPLNIILGAIGAFLYMIWAVRIREVNLVLVNGVVLAIYTYGVYLRFW